MTATPEASAPSTDHVAARLSTLDRFLPVWIGLAMVGGLVLGRLVPGLGGALSAVEVDGVSLPIALGLLIMMYPVLAKVRYDRLDSVTADRRMLGASLVLNWVVGPALMFALAWLLLPDLPEYRTGLIIVGLARCIAMVIIWNDLACGDREAAAVLVALNSLFQVVAFAGLGWFYLSVLPGWLGLPQETLDVSPWQIAVSVLVFLGIPLLLGFLSRQVGERRWGRTAYEESFLPRIGPWALYGLLFTIVVLFALQGEQITSQPLDVARIALPLLIYFMLMWGGGFALGLSLRMTYPRTTTLAFTAAGNNFELAIAVAIATFGVTSGQALAGVVGPLIEVPVLVGLGLRLPRPPKEVSPCLSAPPSSSSASTTRAGRRWPPHGCRTCPAARSRCARRAAHPATRSTRPPSRRCSRRASTSVPRCPRSSRRMPWSSPTSSSRWAAATPARSTPASATRTGSSTTLRAREWTPCARSVTRSAVASSSSSRASGSSPSPERVRWWSRTHCHPCVRDIS